MAGCGRPQPSRAICKAVCLWFGLVQLLQRAPTQPTRIKMFGFFKNIVRKLVSTPADYEEPAASEAWPEEEAYEAPAPEPPRAAVRRDPAPRKNGSPQAARG